MPTKNHKVIPLSDLVVSQIAAGEVIRRPASVLKELLENALDAQATEIKIFTEEGGKTYIQVIDNGTGMTAEDAQQCFNQNATSKLQHLDDLYQLQTYGFRGEGLSSIRVAAARVTLKTRRAEEEIGTQFTLENGQIKKKEPVTTEKGTQVAVHNLFGNIPARLHFLKSNSIENSHLIETFQRIAMPHKDVSFSYWQNQKEIYHLPAVKKLSQRIVHLLGKNYKKQLIPCQEETEDITIHGYIGRPEFARKTNKKQFFFVNNRYIKSPYLHHAIKKAYENLIPQEASPFYAIFINVDPKKIDVNIHPTKIEVKFEQENLIYAMINATIRKALSTHQIMPSLDFDQTATTLFSFTNNDTNQQVNHETTQPLAFFTTDTLTKKSNLWPQTSIQQRDPLAELTTEKRTEIPTTQEPLPESKQEKIDISAPQKIQVHNQYIIAQIKSGIIIIDQERAYERIIYEDQKEKNRNSDTKTQRLLFPTTLSLEPAAIALLQECKEEITSLGFEFQIKDHKEVIISGQPINLKESNPEELFLSIVEEYKKEQTSTIEEKKDRWIKGLAKRACKKQTKPLTPEEINALVDRLFSCQQSNYTPDGKKIWTTLSLQKTQELFYT